LVFVVSSLSMQHYGVSAKSGWLGFSVLCQSGSACLPVTVVVN
jgi:hypothetical protein